VQVQAVLSVGCTPRHCFYPARLILERAAIFIPCHQPITVFYGFLSTIQIGSLLPNQYFSLFLIYKFFLPVIASLPRCLHRLSYCLLSITIGIYSILFPRISGRTFLQQLTLFVV
jgi:hypothetical protein